MPKATSNEPRRNRQIRGDSVLCRCKSWCLQLNAVTGKYEGRGEWMSARRRAWHRVDDRLASLLQPDDGAHEVQNQLPPVEEDATAREERWVQLIQAQLAVYQDLPVIAVDNPLKFVNDPKDSGEYQFDYNEEDGFPRPNTGKHSLDTRHQANRPYIDQENTLWEIWRMLQGFHQTEEVVELRLDVQATLTGMETEKAMQWETARGRRGDRPVFNTEVFFKHRSARAQSIDAACILSLVLQYHYALPRRGCELYLSGVKDITSHLLNPEEEIRVPKDPRPLTSQFNLDPITTTYISCPDCHCLYPYNPVQRLLNNPMHCSYKKTPTSEPCAAALWKEANMGPIGIIKKPIRKYIHQGLKPWLGRILSRPGMEALLDGYPRSLLGGEDREEAVDIWHGEVFQTFKDTSHHPFFPGPEGELRFAFSLSVDSFSPFQNKTAKQSASSTGIWMVLLNFPTHLRYLPQNVYLAGVIPGPSKPSNDQINHYTQLIVKDLKEFWDPGVYFSRTHDLVEGRLCKGALIPLVCDLLAAHQVVGYPGAPTAHYFCTCCDLDIDDVNQLDRREWPEKDPRHIRRYATIYRDSASEADQQAVFEACGWRWSALLELEYWNPHIFTVIDSMHSLDLNLLQNHVRVLFRIDVKSNGGVALRPPTSARIKRVTDDSADLRALRGCQELIFDNPPRLLYELLRYQRKVLFSFCIDYDIRSPGHQTVVGTRWILAKNIHLWRQNAGSPAVQTFLLRYPRFSISQEDLIQSADRSSAQEDNEGHQESQPVEDGGIPPTTQKLPKPSALRRLAKKLLDLVVNGDEGKDALYSQITAATIAHFCDVAPLDRSHIGSGTSPLSSFKRQLFNFILQKLSEDQATQDLLVHHFGEDNDAPATRATGAFLGKDVMTAVWADMTRTQLPSWITAVARDWGTVRRGKLSADNWRVICCIHLPITLIRLFGTSEGRPRALLDNFMHLVSAVRIATMRRSSPAQIEAYNSHISAYSRGTLELFPEYSVLPSHHAALHIGDMLQRFGPKHSHDSPYYERYILFFHSLNTNNKIGEIEGTYLRSAVRNANILALLDDSADDRRLVEEMLARLQKHQKERLRGFRLAQSLDPFVNREGINEGLELFGESPGLLSPLDFNFLCELLQSSPLERNTPVSREVVFLEAISSNGNTYAKWDSRRYRDSAVLYDYNKQGEKAGVIQSIFLHHHRLSTGEMHTSRYLSVLEYTPTQSDGCFRRYGQAGGFCCSLNPTIARLIRLESVICHVAVTTFDEENMVHILPLSKSLLSFELKPFQGAEVDLDFT